jgi:Ca-activated chloride channel homolog
MSRFLFLLALVCAGSQAYAAATGAAPYLAAADGSVEALPLVLTSVEVGIAGVVADVRVKQVYENRGSVPIEAVYVFPGSSRAAIHGLELRIGERVIRADVREKAKARAEYETALAEGKTASLLEQLDPSIFRMSVANVLPGDRIEVDLKYSELLVPTRGEYEFFFPHTVGQRYAAAADAAPATPASSAADVTDYAFDLSVRLEGALPLAEVGSPSHAVDVARPAPHAARVTLGAAAQRDAGTRDYVLRFRYAGEQIQSGALLHPEGEGGYFLLLAEPPRRIEAGAILPREFIFVVDVSGSMHGQPLDIAEDLLGDLVGALRPTDMFNVLLFSGGSKVLAPEGSVPATAANVTAARELIGNADAGGGTELVQALEVAYALPARPGYARSVVIVTDGAIWAGGPAFRVIRSHLAEANVFAFGIGPSVEHEVIARLARAGAGEPFIVDELGKGREVAARMRSYIDRPLLTDIAIEAAGIELLDLEPQPLPDLLAERPLVLVGKYRGNVPGMITVSGMTGGTPYRQVLSLDPATARPLPALRQLWARERIQRLLDEQSGGGSWSDSMDPGIDHSTAITALGLEHHLLTPYTSFVAVDQVVRSDGSPVPVSQPAVAKGIGFALWSRRAAIALPPPASSAAIPDRHAAGRDFALRDGTWTDRAFDRQIVLRVRPDSAAWHALLGLCPELAEMARLGVRVLVAFGTHAILITPDGFSDYPPEVLAAAVRGTRS